MDQKIKNIYLSLQAAKLKNKMRDRLVLRSTGIPGTRYTTIFPPDRGMLRRSRCVQIFLLNSHINRSDQQKKKERMRPSLAWGGGEAIVETLPACFVDQIGHVLTFSSVGKYA